MWCASRFHIKAITIYFFYLFIHLSMTLMISLMIILFADTNIFQCNDSLQGLQYLSNNELINNFYKKCVNGFKLNQLL